MSVRTPRRPGTLRPIVLLAALALLAASCRNDAPKPTQPGTATQYDFSLVDLNPTSPSYNTSVSPAKYLGKPIALFVGAPT